MNATLIDGPARTGLLYDTDNGTQYSEGVVRKSRMNLLSRRAELVWVAGQRGKPGINADIQDAAEATRMIADPDFEILGTNAVSADCAYNAEGGITLSTHGADLDSTILAPHLDANQTPWTRWTWGTDKETVWECDFATGAAITTSVIWAGLKLTNTPTGATDNDQVFIRYENGVSSGVWVVWYSIGGTDTTVVSTVTVAVSTRYHLKIAIDANRIAKVYLSVGSNPPVLLATTTALTDATDLIPYIGVKASGVAAARSVTVYGEAIGRNVG